MIELTLVRTIKALPNLFSLLSGGAYALNLPENSPLPCLLLQSISGNHEQLYSGLSGEQQSNIQIDVWAKHPNDLIPIKKLLVPLMADLKGDIETHHIIGVFDIAERKLNIKNEHRLTLELTIQYKDL